MTAFWLSYAAALAMGGVIGYALCGWIHHREMREAWQQVTTAQEQAIQMLTRARSLGAVLDRAVDSDQ